MQTICRANRDCVDRSAGNAGQQRGSANSASTPIMLNLPTGAVLFQPGDKRRLYRLESGAVWHYIRWAHGRHEVIETAFPGDILGMGTLNHHVSTARAMVATVVSVIAGPDLEAMLLADHRLSLRHSIAGEREFDYLRDKAINARKRSPVERVASYLVVISNMKALEGGEAILIPNEISSGFVSERLQMSLDTLALALVSLEKSGLIAATTAGLRITNFAALETFADAA